MKCNARLTSIFAGICLASLTGWACADVALPDQKLLSTAAAYTQNSSSYMLALNEDNAGTLSADASTGATMTEAEKQLLAQSKKFEPPTFSASNAHKFMGLTTVALVALTALTAPEEEEGATVSTKSRTQGTHQSLGRTAAVMAAATVTSGLLAHWDDFHLEDGITDPDNLHAMLGALGSLAMLNAVSKAPGDGHPASGLAGGVAMAAAIKLTW